MHFSKYLPSYIWSELQLYHMYENMVPRNPRVVVYKAVDRQVDHISSSVQVFGYKIDRRRWRAEKLAGICVWKKNSLQTEVQGRVQGLPIKIKIEMIVLDIRITNSF